MPDTIIDVDGKLVPAAKIKGLFSQGTPGADEKWEPTGGGSAPDSTGNAPPESIRTAFGILYALIHINAICGILLGFYFIENELFSFGVGLIIGVIFSSIASLQVLNILNYIATKK